MKKRVKVIMLPTEDSTSIIKLATSSTLYYYSSPTSAATKHLYANQHLHFISDEGIKVGDWCVHLSRGYVFKVYNFGESNGSVTLIPSENNLPEDLEFLLVDCKKVVATTDKSLVYLTNNGRVGYKLPQIPQEFVENYCKVGGIDEVDIEYDLDYDEHSELIGNPIEAWDVIKVDSNNCVLTHPIKNSWNREEVIGILKEYRNCIMPVTQKEIDYLNEWINKNL